MGTLKEGLEEAGKAFVPNRLRPHLRMYFRKAGLNEAPYDLFGVFFFIGFAITLVIFAIYILPWASTYGPLLQLIFIFVPVAVIFFVFVIILAMIIYFFSDLLIFNRTLRMEAVLPDFLEVVSSNLRGGMSFEQSLWAALSPEFSVLSDEISLAAKKVITGTELDVSLEEFVTKYDSDLLKRTISLLISEIKSGGKIADILEKIIINLKETKKLKAEMATSVISYMIFIGAVVIVIAPGLFALSYNIMDIVSGFTNKLAAATRFAGGGAMPFSFSEVQADTEGFKNFSIAALIVISVFSSMIISILEKGNIRAGIKYIPIFMGGSVTFYFIFFSVLTGLFGGLF